MFAFGDKEWPGLAKLNEESGELVQVIGKLMMTRGDRQYWDNIDLRKRLIEEMADQAAALDFVQNHVLTVDEMDTFSERLEYKRSLFDKWHAEQAHVDLIEAEIARRVRDETALLRTQYESTRGALRERISEVDRLKHEQAGLVRALGEKELPP